MNTIVIDIIYGEQKSVTIPCGGLDPPYTYTKSGAVLLVEKTNSFYTIPQLKRTNNGDGYCCHAKGDTVCYHLNITCMHSYLKSITYFNLNIMSLNNTLCLCVTY